MPREHIREFANEVYNAPSWMFTEATTLSGPKAAAYLGMGKGALMEYTDLFGLTVLWHQYKGRTCRFYLRSELKALKVKLESARKQDAERAREAEDEFFEPLKKENKKRLRRLGLRKKD